MDVPIELSSGSTSTELERLVTRVSINEVLVAYCQGVDRRNWEQVLACYHDDAVDWHGLYRKLDVKSRKDLPAALAR